MKAPTKKELASFLEEVLAVYHKHGFSPSHEDHHGAFEITPRNEFNDAWFRQAWWNPSSQLTY